MDRINYNFDLVILIKHIIFTEPFIADGSVLMCFLGWQFQLWFYPKCRRCLRLYLDNFIPAARGYPELFSYAFLRRESGENVKGYRWEAPFAGTITNYLLRLNAWSWTLPECHSCFTGWQQIPCGGVSYRHCHMNVLLSEWFLYQQ